MCWFYIILILVIDNNSNNFMFMMMIIVISFIILLTHLEKHEKYTKEPRKHGVFGFFVIQFRISPCYLNK